MEQVGVCLGSPSAEIRAASAQLVLELIEEVAPESAQALVPVMPTVVNVFQAGMVDDLWVSLQSQLRFSFLLPHPTCTSSLLVSTLSLFSFLLYFFFLSVETDSITTKIHV